MQTDAYSFTDMVIRELCVGMFSMHRLLLNGRGPMLTSQVHFLNQRL